jgi:hypothetical protein
MVDQPVTTYEQAIDWAWEKIRYTLIDRQRKYGHENINRSGELGLLVRLNDKLARMENLLKIRGTSILLEVCEEDESVEDTAIDIAGYGIIWVMWLRGLWGKYPLEEDSGNDTGEA